MKLILSTILLFVVVTCINACSKDTHNNAAKTSDPSNITDSNTLIETAIVNTIIDPITIEVLQDNQKMIVKLIGLSLPENKRSSQIHHKINPKSFPNLSNVGSEILPKSLKINEIHAKIVKNQL